ncbi:[protein-PII] uridylyltransferase [Jiella sp. MQZ9-1]|uniref:Bifunctional uridylyltransferase/uridylyl-removing enzyme n=1 Tax=Jiella flava TaxID=2816857 RepID=A0A939FXK2_9HYPH|nr:[protein-PII] uridylyltransferase [Jiella flava]MBO0661367.1 [protein-PII] uridylyltransferase [Jiella flava]MCD2470012.1 [protein-PII] uridylyltransferase [Jiella flava]
MPQQAVTSRATSPDDPLSQIDVSGFIDATGLAQRLAAIAEADSAGGASNDARAAVLAVLREAVKEARRRVELAFREDRAGFDCARRLATIQDVLIRSVHDFALRYVFPSSNLSAGERMAIVAVGGYGRGTLAPSSDIDLLFLLPYKQTALGEQVAEYLLYLLWDLGFKVGHASRTVEECIKLAKADMTIRTSILERWLIVGDRDLFDQLGARFEAEVVEGSSEAFIAAKLAERSARHAKRGDTRYVVEPNVKEGKGGLRDLNTLFWIAKYHYRVTTSEALADLGVISRREMRLFHKAEDFLWAVRCNLHFATGKAEERLSFDLQAEIAERLGYNAHPGLKDVERFMKHFFLIAKDVGDLTRILCAALEEQHAKAAPGIGGIRDLVRSLRGRAKTIPGTIDFHIDNNRINVSSPSVFKDDPVNLIRVFRLAASNNLEYHPDTLKLIRRSLKLINAELRDNPEANSLFLDVLTDRQNPEFHLRRMNEAGVLGRFIPEFGKIVAMMQFSMYHHYTVDEHLLRSIDILSRIELGELADEHPLSSELLPQVKERRALYVALLLHDIAKGRPEDHSIAGAKIARKLCPRLGLDDRETELVSWLIEDHLVMSMTAQQRDINDRKTIHDFAVRVRTLDRLNLLMILTVCDIRAVGPGVWNGWKGQLLRSLYLETEPTLTGGFTRSTRAERLAVSRERLAARLSDWEASERDAYLDLHYPNYFLTTPLEDQVRHADFVRAAATEDPLVIAVRTDAFQSITEIMVLAPDHPRLLSMLAGACAGAGANIADAQVFTMSDGRALDVLVLNRQFAEDADELRRGERVSDYIRKLLQGEDSRTRLISEQKAKRPPAAFAMRPSVRVDNDLSNQFTVIEIEGLDRPGLLSDLTRAMADLNLDIRSAHISTYGEKAVDVFYVTDLVGAKITSGSRTERIVDWLVHVFENPGSEPVTAGVLAAEKAYGFARS